MTYILTTAALLAVATASGLAGWRVGRRETTEHTTELTSAQTRANQAEQHSTDLARELDTLRTDRDALDVAYHDAYATCERYVALLHERDATIATYAGRPTPPRPDETPVLCGLLADWQVPVLDEDVRDAVDALSLPTGQWKVFRVTPEPAVVEAPVRRLTAAQARRDRERQHRAGQVAA